MTLSDLTAATLRHASPRIAVIVGVIVTMGLVTTGCADGGTAASDVADDAEYGKPLLGTPLGSAKSDSLHGTGGPSQAGLSSSTVVWDAPGRWYQVTDEAGIAWAANSGLTWDQKFRAWVDSFEQLQVSSYKTTFTLTTPWGKTLPAPRLECAETAIFLRATFASWYGLPFFMSARHSEYGNLHFGHFGIVLDSGSKVPGWPRFSTSFEDHTAAMADRPTDDLLANWPSDASLRARYLTSQRDDEMEFLGGLGVGAYFDEMFLNKRAGQFLWRLLVSFGSAHLADSARNTFNLSATAIEPGDTLLQRWQRNGIGHTVIVKEVRALEGAQLEVETMFGSMPRIQPKWYDANLSKAYFTASKSGGPGANSAGDEYVHLGGGLKRWRTPVVLDGRWMNIVPVSDREDYISSLSYDQLSARTTQFETMLGQLSVSEKRDLLVAQIDEARRNLSERPASCSNRIRREEAFDALYQLNADEFSTGPAETDAQHRTLADYVFAELVYEDSKTCCWNSSTAAMAEIVLAYNEAHVYDAATQSCQAPVVFKASDGGYDVFAAYAESIGRGHEWVAWSADETCPQADTWDDVEADHDWAPLCDIAEDVLGVSVGGGTEPADDNPPASEPAPPVDDEPVADDSAEPAAEEPAAEEPAADSGSAATYVDGAACGEVTWEGLCDGDTVVWCDGDEIRTSACSGGDTCAWIDEYEYYWCVEG